MLYARMSCASRCQFVKNLHPFRQCFLVGFHQWLKKSRSENSFGRVGCRGEKEKEKDNFTDDFLNKKQFGLKDINRIYSS
jgi:hypothetical protein